MATRETGRTPRVVFNGRFLGRSMTGVERYAYEVVSAIDELIGAGEAPAEVREFVIAVPKGTSTEQPWTHIKCVSVGSLTGYPWEQIELLAFARGDVLVNLCNTAPILHPNHITCVHDAHVWLVPENYSNAFRLIYRFLIPRVIKSSAKWMTVSKFSEASLRRLGVASRAADRVTYNGYEHTRRWDQSRATLKREELPARYVFAIGSLSKNKNFELVAKLSELLSPLGIKVVVAGGGNAKVFNGRPTSDAPLDNIVRVGRVSDDDLHLLYSNALCFVFPSHYEGFGLPLVEAMALGCPVISSNTSAMPEVAGDAAILLDANSVAKWFSAVDELSTKPELRQSLIDAGRRRVLQFSWRETAKAVLELLASPDVTLREAA